MRSTRKKRSIIRPDKQSSRGENVHQRQKNSIYADDYMDTCIFIIFSLFRVHMLPNRQNYASTFVASLPATDIPLLMIVQLLKLMQKSNYSHVCLLTFRTF